MNFQPGESSSVSKSFEYAKKKFLENRQIKIDSDFLQLTSLGRKDLLKQFPLLEWRKKKWDGVWRVVMYDFPENKKSKRDSLRRLLKKLGFAQWQISVWVSPHPVIKELNDLLVEHELEDYCSVHESRRVVGSSDMLFAERIWKLSEINKRYKEVLKEFDENKRLDCLKELMRDPFLPRELLPNDYLWESLMKRVVSLPNQ